MLTYVSELKIHSIYVEFAFYKPPIIKDTNKNMDIVVCGMGPAGLFAALLLTEAGFKVTVIDRGKNVEDRIKDVEKFEKAKYIFPIKETFLILKAHFPKLHP